MADVTGVIRGWGVRLVLEYEGSTGETRVSDHLWANTIFETRAAARAAIEAEGFRRQQYWPYKVAKPVRVVGEFRMETDA